MKKGVLILLGMFMMVSTVEAKKGENLPDRFGSYYSYNNAVNFFERGIEFFIFTNGDFDFDTRSYNNRGIRIERDFRGRIRSVGNVFINYDRRGNVTRVGNIFMRYNRGRLAKVGNLRVSYDRWDYPVFYGDVRNFYYNNGVRFNVSFGDVFNYNDAYFFRNDFRRNYSQFREDRNFYYYRANANAKTGKRSSIIKRRKAISNNTTRTIKRGNNSYRKPKSNLDTRRNTDTRKTESKRKASKVINRKIDKKSSYRNLDTKKEKSSTRKRRN
jgi:hypothetical protein